jgi:hypothetical protein
MTYGISITRAPGGPCTDACPCLPMPIHVYLPMPFRKKYLLQHVLTLQSTRLLQIFISVTAMRTPSKQQEGVCND